MTQLSALDSWHVYVRRIEVTGSPSYATTSVTLTSTVSTKWQETFTKVNSQAIEFHEANSLRPPALRAADRYFSLISAKFIQKTPKKLIQNEESSNLELNPSQNPNPKTERAEESILKNLKSF